MHPANSTQLPQHLPSSFMLYAPYPPVQTRTPKESSRNSKRSTITVIPAIPPTIPPTSILPVRPIPLPGYLNYHYSVYSYHMPSVPHLPLIRTADNFIPPAPISTNQTSEQPAPVLSPILEIVDVDDSPTFEPMKLDLPTTGVDSDLHIIIGYMNEQVDRLKNARTSNAPSGTSTDKSIDSGSTSNVSPKTITSPKSLVNINPSNIMPTTMINSPPNVFNNTFMDSSSSSNVSQTTPNAIVPNNLSKNNSLLWAALQHGSNLPVNVNTFNMGNTDAVNQGIPISSTKATAAQGMKMEDIVVKPPGQSGIGVFDWYMSTRNRQIEQPEVQRQMELFYQAMDNGSGPRLRIIRDHNPNTRLLQNLDLFPSLKNADGSLKPRINKCSELDGMTKRPLLNQPPFKRIDFRLPRSEWNYLHYKDRYQRFLYSKSVEKICHLQHNTYLIKNILCLKACGKQAFMTYGELFTLRWSEMKHLENHTWKSIHINVMLNAGLLEAQIRSVAHLPAEEQISLLTEMLFDTRGISGERKFPESYETVQQWFQQALESITGLDPITKAAIGAALNRDSSSTNSEKRVQEIEMETGVERVKLLQIWQQVHCEVKRTIIEGNYFYFSN